MTTDIFLSVGQTARQEQENFSHAVEQLLEEHGLHPRTVGKTDYVTEKPIEKIMEVMQDCSGAVIIAFERLAFDRGIELPNSENATPVKDIHIPTVWNQIEAAMAYALGLPLLAIAESHLRKEGFLEDGYDWFLEWVDPTPESLYTDEFQIAFEKWKDDVMKFKK